MTAVYLAAKLLTFPGAFLKAFWEHCTLKLLRVPVEDASFLHLNELFGHIEHRLIEGKAKNMVFCILPGLLNGLLSVPLLFTSSVNLFYLGVGMRDAATGLINIMFFVYVAMFWVGISLWCNKCPLYEDVLQLKEKLYAGDVGKVKKALTVIPVSVISAGSLLERYGLNVLTFAGVTAVLVYLFPYAFV